MLIDLLIVLIIVVNLIYAYQYIFQTRAYIEKYGFGEGSAIMTRLVGTFAAGFAVTSAIALLTSIEEPGCCLSMVLCRPASVLGFATIHSRGGSVEGVKTSAEGYIAPAIVAILNLMVLVIGWEDLFKI